jgi:hypothetical protein
MVWTLPTENSAAKEQPSRSFFKLVAWRKLKTIETISKFAKRFTENSTVKSNGNIVL